MVSKDTKVIKCDTSVQTGMQYDFFALGTNYIFIFLSEWNDKIWLNKQFIYFIIQNKKKLHIDTTGKTERRLN